MTSRQRVKAAINPRPCGRGGVNHQKPDKMPCNESPWPDTVELWHKQGLPKETSVADYFGFDICAMSLDCSPRFEQKIIRHEGQYYTYQDRYGYTARKLYGKSSTIDFSSHVTKDKLSWEKHKHRWTLSDDPNEPARIDDASYFEHFDPYPSWDKAREKYMRLYDIGRYMLFDDYGPWESTWRHRGYQNQLMDVALEPDWLRKMAQTHQRLTIAVMKRCLELKMKPDGFFMVEDVAANRGLLLSPDSWRDIFKPMVKELGEFLAENDIDFWMHCCGNPETVFDDLIECGVKVIQPLQASTGLNVVDLRKKYGKKLAFYGNISAPKMAGPLDELEKEISSKVVIAKDGGYIFHSDHSVPPNVTFERYKWIIETARKYADN